MNSTHGNDQMMQQSMGDPSISGRPPDNMNNSGNSNAQQLQMQPPPNMALSMTPFPGMGGLGGDQQLQGPPGTGPPPRCQIVSPFLGIPPLVPHDRMLLQQQQQQQQPNAGGSSLGQQMDNSFVQDMRHRGYPGVINLPPPFQVHPNLQSQLQAFQQDMGQHGSMTQPPGPNFLQGFIPTEINVSPNVSDSRTAHMLQPHVRQRARRRSRANRASTIQSHVHEATVLGGGDAASATALGRAREVPPTAQITVDATFGDVEREGAGAGAGAGLEDAKLKGLEENYASIGENFECNICFQKANEAVVTCCGHLFCWPCLYRWLHIHSYHKECPVCKGAIDESTITPIYGRECSALLSARGLPGGSAGERIPPRPPARRVESARQLREREDREREREQRERALEREREREREESERQELAEALGQGVVTALIEEAASGMRDSSPSAIHSVLGQAGGGGGGGGEGEITVDSAHAQQQEEIESRASGGHEDTSSSGGVSVSQTTPPPGMNAAASGFQEFGRAPTSRVLRPQGATGGAPGSGNHNYNNNSTSMALGGPPTFLQRRVSDRREQLRAALAAAARTGTSAQSNLTDRVDERRQMMAAAALISQEWEDVVNNGRLMQPVNLGQAGGWVASSPGQGRPGSMEGTSVDGLDLQFYGGGGPGVAMHGQPIHRSHAFVRHGIAPPEMGFQDGSSGRDDIGVSRLITVNPLQTGELLAARRSLLTSMGKIVENMMTPTQACQQPQSAGGPAAAAATATALHHFNVPFGQSSVSNAQAYGRQLQTASATPGLQGLSLMDALNPHSASQVCSEGPNARALEERAAVAANDGPEREPLPSPASASSSSTSTSTPAMARGNVTSQSESRLHYREAPVPKPGNSGRRRSARTADEGSSMNISHNNNHNNSGNNNDSDHGQSNATANVPHPTTEGSGYTGPPETPSSRPKRRRME